MEFGSLQLFALTTWLAGILAAACCTAFPIGFRIGFPCILLGGLLTFGRSIFPRPPLRDHVPNDRKLQKIFDLVFLGIPATGLFWLGLLLIFWSFSVSVVGTVLAMTAYTVYIVSQQ